MSPGTLGACGLTSIERSSVTCKISMRNTTAVGTTTEDQHVRTSKRGTSSPYPPTRNPHASETPVLSWHPQHGPAGLDHGAGHSLLLLCDAKASRGKNSMKFKGLGDD